VNSVTTAYPNPSSDGMDAVGQTRMALPCRFSDAGLGEIDFIQGTIFQRCQISYHHIGTALEAQLSPLFNVDRCQRSRTRDIGLRA